jgi:hypothetical protein
MIASPCHPTGKENFLANVVLAQLACLMRTEHKFPRELSLPCWDF